MSPTLLDMLRRHWLSERSPVFLFPGQFKDRPITLTTIQKVCTRWLAASV